MRSRNLTSLISGRAILPLTENMQFRFQLGRAAIRDITTGDIEDEA